MLLTRQNWLLSTYIILIISFIIMVAVSPHTLIYDEPLHLEGARLIICGGSIPEMLVAPLPSAPGPLYPILHSAIYPITKFEAPAVRYLNLFFLLVSITTLILSLRCLFPGKSWLCVGMILGVPMTWVTAGMALTEIPALTMINLSLAVGLWAIKQPKESWHYYAGFIISAIFSSFGILGRQTYLPILSIYLVGLIEQRWRWPSAISLTVICGIVTPVFILWKGIIPPSQSQIGGGVVLEHGFLAFAYLAMILVIIAPRFYLTNWKLILLVGSLGYFLNLTITRFEWVALTGVAKYLPLVLQDRYPLIIGSFLLSLFISFLTAALYNIWIMRDNKLFLLSAGETILLTSTAFGITHLFSSRYVMTSFPFLLFMAQPFFEPSVWAGLRVLAGAAIGFAALSTYYW